MLDLLPNELLWNVFSHLSYQDLDRLSEIKPISTTTIYFIQQHYNFHYKTNTLLGLYEAITPTERHSKETKHEFANKILQSICTQVVELPKFEHRNKFTELLDIVQQFVIDRILADDLKAGLEHDYANLCLEVRSLYLHTPSIRVLHDPKYRRRSTKHPLAPFLPRDYTYVWRQHCAEPMKDRTKHTRFALFFGSLFDLTSLYLESNLDGSFEECVREALVSGNAEDLLIMCIAAYRPVDVEGMRMMVTHAGEQLRHYLETLDNRVTTDPTPQQEYRMQQQQQQQPLFEGDDMQHTGPPEWLIPDRYRVAEDTVLRLKLMDHLYRKGWRWFQ
ncbi:hypothetical protein BD560DRAFT_71475 [Blakeslea trispora]|nr:hypothetical protein BD560DRAFT_71475 [Blakeslea trispora]